MRLLLLLLLPLQVLAATFTAEVNRTQLTANDSLSLVLKIDEQVAFASPDLSPLEKDFDVLGQNRSNQYRSINGKAESWTQWKVQIAPKREGTLIIPALTLDGNQSQPISIQVQKVAESVKGNAGKEVFFDVKLDKESAYVQEQIIYTEKLYFSVPLQNSQLSELKVTDAVVTQLGETRSYETRINGVAHGVIERRFAIFPQTSGELIIPGQRFSAVAGTRFRQRELGTRSALIKMDIQAKPASYPQAPWLPAKQLTIVESWPSSTDHLIQGEGITRSIRINAEGLSGAQIPAIAQPVVNGLKYYPDQSQSDEKRSEQGIQGIRLESLAIMPTQSGLLELPEIRIPWWNTTTDKLEYAVLPARTLNIMAPAQQLQPSVSIPEPQPETVTPIQSTDEGFNGWMLATLLLALSNIVTLLIVISKGNQVVIKENKQDEQKPLSERQALKAFKDACKNNQMLQIRSSLIAWIQLKSGQEINSLDDIAKLYPELSNDLKALDNALYSQQGDSAYNSQALKDKALKLEKIKHKKDSLQLQPLYK